MQTKRNTSRRRRCVDGRLRGRVFRNRLPFLSATSMWFCVLCRQVDPPAPGRLLGSFLPAPKCQAFRPLSLTFVPSLLHSIFYLFCFACRVLSAPCDALRRGGGRRAEGSTAGGGRAGWRPAGTYVTEDESVRLSVCLFDPVRFKPGGLQVTAKRTSVSAPQTADTCSSSVEKQKIEGERLGRSWTKQALKFITSFSGH